MSRIRALLRALNAATDLQSMLDVLHGEVSGSFGTTTAWLAVCPAAKGGARVVTACGEAAGRITAGERWSVDACSALRALMTTEEPVAIADARSLENGSSAFAERHGLRTLLLLPLRGSDGQRWIAGFAAVGDTDPPALPDDVEDDLSGLTAAAGSALARITLATSAEQELQRAGAVERVLQGHLDRYRSLDDVGQLASGIAHDLNNVLMAIQAGAFSLEHSPLSLQGRESVRQITTAVASAGALTRRLSALGRGATFERARLDACAVIADACEIVRMVLPDEVSLGMHHDEQPVPVLGDRHALEQVLVNLMLNARDAMPKGGRILVNSSQVWRDGTDPDLRREGRYARIAVMDTGTGITPEVRARIFEPFFTTKGDRGTGLGLAMANHTVRQHLGALRCASVPGHGTTFEILLPLCA